MEQQCLYFHGSDQRLRTSCDKCLVNRSAAPDVASPARWHGMQNRRDGHHRLSLKLVAVDVAARYRALVCYSSSGNKYINPCSENVFSSNVLECEVLQYLSMHLESQVVTSPTCIWASPLNLY